MFSRLPAGNASCHEADPYKSTAALLLSWFVCTCSSTNQPHSTSLLLLPVYADTRGALPEPSDLAADNCEQPLASSTFANTGSRRGRWLIGYLVSEFFVYYHVHCVL